MKYEVYFFANGNIAVTDGNWQVPELQSKSAVQLFLEHAQSKGYDPLDFVLNLSAGKAYPFKTEDGFNWEFK